MKDTLSAWYCIVIVTVILCVVSCKEERPFGITFTTTYVLRDTNARVTAIERQHLNMETLIKMPDLILWYAEAVKTGPSLDRIIHAYIEEHGMLPPSTSVWHMHHDYVRDKSVGDTGLGGVLSEYDIAHYDDTIMHYDEHHHRVADSIPTKGYLEGTMYRTTVVPFKRGWIYRLYWIGENYLDERLKGDDVLLLEGIIQERR